jgi:hypothetical protein
MLILTKMKAVMRFMSMKTSLMAIPRKKPRILGGIPPTKMATSN